jgi:hypothetical protein
MRFAGPSEGLRLNPQFPAALSDAEEIGRTRGQAMGKVKGTT